MLGLDEDRGAGRLEKGDFIVFLWIGVGNGANGYAVVAL